MRNVTMSRKMIRPVLIGILSVFFCHSIALAQKESVTQAANRFGQTLYYLDNYYLDSVDFKSLIDASILAALQELDPHSSYVKAEDLVEVSEPLEASFQGVGIEFAIIRDTLTVQGVVQGGPAQKVGIAVGDKFIYIGDDLVAGVSLKNADVRKYLRGKKGTKVNLRVRRAGIPYLLKFVVTRDVIPLNSLEAMYEPEPGILYMKLSRFAASSYNEIHTAIVDFLSEGPARGMILDLRGNGGGYLGAAIDIANEFLKNRSLIVSTEGRAFSPVYELANGRGIYTSGPLCVLIDENSASASEILSGALQDHDRAIIIGRRSFGKGVVQRALPLNDGSQLRLTIARYHTPSGRVIQSPYRMGDKKGYYENFYRRYVDGEIYNRDSIKLGDMPVYYTLERNRKVYGGGGIIPDVFIPSDTSFFSGYFNALLRQGIVIEFVNRKVDRMRKEWLKRYPTYEEFSSADVVNRAMMDELIGFAREKSILPARKDLEQSYDYILNYVKALTVSSLYSHSCFYRVMNSYGDKAYDEAIRILSDWEAEYEKLMTGGQSILKE